MVLWVPFVGVPVATVPRRVGGQPLHPMRGIKRAYDYCVTCKGTASKKAPKKTFPNKKTMQGIQPRRTQQGLHETATTC